MCALRRGWVELITISSPLYALHATLFTLRSICRAQRSYYVYVPRRASTRTIWESVTASTAYLWLFQLLTATGAVEFTTISPLEATLSASVVAVVVVVVVVDDFLVLSLFWGAEDARKPIIGRWVGSKAIGYHQPAAAPCSPPPTTAAGLLLALPSLWVLTLLRYRASVRAASKQDWGVLRNTVRAKMAAAAGAKSGGGRGGSR